MRNLILAAFLSAIAAGSATSQAAAAPWLDERFDSYASGPLAGQGNWTGNTQRVSVVSTNSLSGKAVCCDADESPLLPVIYEVWQSVPAPDSGRHVFSFAVRVETPTRLTAGVQASLCLGNDQTAAISLLVLPTTVTMTLNNDFLEMPPPTMSWDLGSVPGGATDLTTGTYHRFELDLDFGQANNTMDDFVREVRFDGHAVSGLAGPIWLAKPMDRLTLRNGEAEESAAPDAVFFDGIIGRPAEPALWLNETFDDYEVGPLIGQGGWTGVSSRVAVVSTNSLTGNAAFCDADDPPSGGPFATHALLPVNVPDSGEHVLSFAVRVETPTESFASQAALELGSSVTRAIQLEISPLTVQLRINNDFLDCVGLVVWDLGTVPGGQPDFTTGTYHVLEIELDFGRPGDTMDDAVRAVRMDANSYEFGCGSIALQSPADTLYLVNGMAAEGSTPDAVFFDNIIGRRLVTATARCWQTYF